MIAEYTHDLINKLKTVTALGERVAATLGGTEADPTLAQIELPFAWVLLDGMTNAGERAQRHQIMYLNFVAVLVIEYGGEEDGFIDTHLKLIDDASQAVRGPIEDIEGDYNWNFDGASLISVNPDRIAYELKFSAQAAYAKQLT